MKKNRQSVIRDDNPNFNSRLKDKTKSRIRILNEDNMDEDMKEDIKEDSFYNNQEKKEKPKKKS